MKIILKYPISCFLLVTYFALWILTTYLLRILDYSDSPAKGFVALISIVSFFSGIALLLIYLIAIIITKEKHEKKMYKTLLLLIIITYIIDIMFI